MYVDLCVPLAPVRALVVEVQTTSLGRGDCFLEDIIIVFLVHLAIIKNVTSILLAMHVLMRPLATDEPVPRKETLPLSKLLPKGTPSEQMIVLGWLIDTCPLLLCLPQDKLEQWSKECIKLLAEPKTSRAALESLIGKIVHATYVIPLSFFVLITIPTCLDEREKIEHLMRIPRKK